MKISRILPPPLKPGDIIGIAAVAGQIRAPELLYKGITIIREMGFEVRFQRDLWPGSSYLADSDANRAKEFNTLLRDPEVKAIIALRGGFGSLRILDRLEPSVLVQQPKFVVGFSDISILHSYLHQATGVVTLHGPVMTSLAGATPESLERLYRSLTGKWYSPVEMASLEIIVDGDSVERPVAGGNLASLVTLLGTPYDFPWRDRIIFLEDINEPLYKIDRMLTQLEYAGKFDEAAGILLGDFSDPHEYDRIEHLRYIESIWTRVEEICSKRGVAVWANFPAGHTGRNLTFPLGATARMDKKSSTVFFS
ncbi:S66 peptidase family protein [Desulforhopalus singaporensis]|uniref:Muramoyltetrapeptide carboxypeptidase n=1 Tax=Desulforhopalus singaporensis TaxID=91360 RepID=A0A1H0QI56_9BACT|nr:LD-carboxypeptidase [Desulforhopalus singaporensis]SDP16964.1 muramoyltetrapeptide carboxypeptidase [Desulforhopalus singaporensis]